jgi:prolyl oligopeptidase
MEKLWNYEKIGAPLRKEISPTTKNDGLQNQSVMYRKDAAAGKEEIFLDPNTF